jgi:hypothetical protein
MSKFTYCKTVELAIDHPKVGGSVVISVEFDRHQHMEDIEKIVDQFDHAFISPDYDVSKYSERYFIIDAHQDRFAFDNIYIIIWVTVVQSMFKYFSVYNVYQLNFIKNVSIKLRDYEFKANIKDLEEVRKQLKTKDYDVLETHFMTNVNIKDRI